ncbi:MULTISPECIES: hypothetical protein [Pseudomonas syringae group]|uniref:Lipoprotein n=1 Tax=Pseudomonas meliae TaxID=86176 RepID=A0A0P9U0F1_9PSED|nr:MULTISPECIES: hypothetical protein [Pseudomonas syringae group]KPX80404.1 Uncharacterized protein ALO64_00869 [Pseudomonas meliae]RMV50770.1 hypothetical protein ALP09_200022 [Pseudomonas amygdali pv. lachrymans]RXU06348.1 hypothetical protein B1F68_12525 [Pseudomonas syringae]
MKKALLMIGISAVLTGCNTTHVTGTGEFFSLSSRNVVYRDLTRPVSVDNEPEKANYVVVPAKAQ